MYLKTCKFYLSIKLLICLRLYVGLLPFALQRRTSLLQRCKHSLSDKVGIPTYANWIAFGGAVNCATRDGVYI